MHLHEQEKVRDVLSSFGEMGEAVGIYVLSEQGTIFSKERSKEPVEYNANLRHSSIFKLLRKKEYESVLKEYFGFVPETDPVFHFRVCLEKFEEIPILEAQHLALQEMKKRSKITVEQFGKIRPELKAVVYFSNLEKQTPMLNQLLDTPYRR